jgi:hypothetical protein
MIFGKKLTKGEESRSGVYALCASRSGVALRVSLIKEFAEEMCDYNSRYITECFLEK